SASEAAASTSAKWPADWDMSGEPITCGVDLAVRGRDGLGTSLADEQSRNLDTDTKAERALQIEQSGGKERQQEKLIADKGKMMRAMNHTGSGGPEHVNDDEGTSARMDVTNYMGSKSPEHVNDYEGISDRTRTTNHMGSESPEQRKKSPELVNDYERISDRMRTTNHMGREGPEQRKEVQRWGAVKRPPNEDNAKPVAKYGRKADATETQI
ncbi:hypothetical protein EV359DRAFT_69251, partial [Lentinula novae-zelandiae]